MPASSKKQRQNLIRRIIAEEEIFSQEELRNELLKRSVNVTQATLSRDIADLGLVKQSATGTYTLPENVTEHTEAHAILARMRQLVQEIDFSGNLVLVKTAPGDAQAAGLAMDHLQFKEVVGTIAGDDTLLVVIRAKYKASGFAKKLEKMLAGEGQ